MPAERFFASEVFIPGKTLLLDEKESHHLLHAMRGKVGETVELINGFGTLAEAVILEPQKKQAKLQIRTTTHTPPPDVEIILAQAIPRANRLDFIVEKGTELGMTQLWLFPGQMGERITLTDHQLERYRLLAISAVKQSGRMYIPQISLHPALEQWPATPYQELFGDLDPKAPKCGEVIERGSTGILFYIGPESGFSEKELAILQKRKATGVKLHSNTLRSDTAALAALLLCNN